MQTVEKMIKEILAREGGFIHRSDEDGGPTHFGITQNNLSGFFGRYASLVELQMLSPDIASKIYLRNYYQAPKIDRLPQLIQPFVFGFFNRRKKTILSANLRMPTGAASSL